ncbi:XRE family transcriptional regulator [Streptomyces sp. SID3343]|uniref:XRE family transcriptional regulator n=1 Tax=Streptomyces sp. SID3343 TaxID=2690260 RepID=UPI00136CBF23|nr:XRE family transcriptional regulator [Streptomyces sp. SID3343]MYW04091.1 hypothetical protein [Streptomyces sp. SID3343]
MARHDTAPQPEPATTTREFVARLRALKDWSGLSYRELSARAEEGGHYLPHSTLAGMLARETLPGEERVDAMVRACGLGDSVVDGWLAVHRRLADGPVGARGAADAATDGWEPDTEAESDAESGAAGRAPLAENEGGAVPFGEVVLAPPPVRSGDEDGPPAGPVDGLRRRAMWRRPVNVVAGVVVLALCAVFVVAERLDDAGRERESQAVPSLELAPGSAGSWALIHPVRSTDLCVTDGREHTGRYKSAVAAQRSCAQVTEPRTFLSPVEGGFFRIQWHHSEHGIGCLTVMSGGPAENMLEPWVDCGGRRPTQLFRIEAVEAVDAGVAGAAGAAGVTDTYRIRPFGRNQCLGIRAAETAPDVEVVRERCTGGADQEFLIDLIKPG